MSNQRIVQISEKNVLVSSVTPDDRTGYSSMDVDEDGKIDIVCDANARCNSLNPSVNISQYGLADERSLTAVERRKIQQDYDTGGQMAMKRYGEFKRALNENRVKMGLDEGTNRHYLFYTDGEGQKQEVELAKLDKKGLPDESLSHVNYLTLDQGIDSRCIFDDPAIFLPVQEKLDNLFRRLKAADENTK